MPPPRELRLDPETIDTVTRICDEVIERFGDAIRKAERLTNVDGFGDLESGRQLAAGFARKAAGTPESMVERLYEHRAAFIALRDRIMAGDTALFGIDRDSATALRDVRGA